MNLSEFNELKFQALYRYRTAIGWLNDVQLLEQPFTARVDVTTKTVEISQVFYEAFIKNVEDLAFILGHESAHNTIDLILATNLELNFYYSLLLARGWDSNFLQDFFINQMLFHGIPSNLPERYYTNTKEWPNLFLQRRLQPFERLKLETNEQESKLQEFKHACQDWYKTDDFQMLKKVFETGCQFLVLFEKPGQSDEQPMVEHPKEETEECSGTPEQEQLTSSAGKGSAEFPLRIPLVDDFSNCPFQLFDTQTALQSLASSIEFQTSKLQEQSGFKRFPGWSDPTDEELVSWAIEQYIPWTEGAVNPQSQPVVVIFDVSGSMFKYLAALSLIRNLLSLYSVTYYAFSNVLSTITFHEKYASVQTGFGTSLDRVLDLLKQIEPSNVFLISDAMWSLSAIYNDEQLASLFRKHRVTLFQQGQAPIPYVPKELFCDIQHL